jgi:FtsP/CotA-like multicopper oxidase with cupredoxin domain
MVPLLAALLLQGAALVRHAPEPAPPRAVANDNRAPAGRRVGDTVVVRLVARRAAWRIDRDDDPALDVLAFAEEGGPPRVPGPLLRARLGTPFRVAVRNEARDTLFVHGLASRAGGGAAPPLVVAPGATADTRFAADREGTFLYWGSLRRAPLAQRFGRDSPLSGALVVDPSAPAPIPPDRVFVIDEVADSVLPPAIPIRFFLAINGKAWPHTERLEYDLGDSIRWRVVNASPTPHPMHLHGFYFRVDARGGAAGDSIFAPDARRMSVTERLAPGETMRMVWSPDRPGGWLFHCHLLAHVAPHPPIDRRDVVEFPSHDAHDPDHHVLTGMSGLVLATTVRAPPRWAAEPPARRRMRLYVLSDSAPNDTIRRFGYALQRGRAEPPPRAFTIPGPTLFLTRGEPTAIEVVNRSGEPTGVHWHGMELESYYDGAIGVGGVAGHLAPAIRDGATFEARMTPPRAGTFIYHTHFSELRQHFGGLYGALIVLEPGERWDPERDHVVLLSQAPGRRGAALGGAELGTWLNGSAAPDTLRLRMGTTHRLRLINIAPGRPMIHFQLARAGEPVRWRVVAKDGWSLPERARVASPAVRAVTIGETVDVEVDADAAGPMALEVRAANGKLLVGMPVVVRSGLGAGSREQ